MSIINASHLLYKRINNSKKKGSLDAEKVNFINKNRPQSANIKKNHGKSAERMKKKAITRQRIQENQGAFNQYVNNKLFTYSKDGHISKNLAENRILTEGNSFDREEVLRNKLFK